MMATTRRDADHRSPSNPPGFVAAPSERTHPVARTRSPARTPSRWPSTRTRTVAGPHGVRTRMSSVDDGDAGVKRDSVSPQVSPRWLRSSDEGGLSATPTSSTSRGALSGAMWRTSDAHDSSARCRHADPSSPHDERQSAAVIAPTARFAARSRSASATRPHAMLAHATVAASPFSSRAPGAIPAPTTSAMAHHVSHATGGCDRCGGSRAARRTRAPVSMRMASMSHDPSDGLRGITAARPKFAQLVHSSALSRIRRA